MMLHENMFYVKQTKKLTLHEKVFHGGKNKMRLHKKKKILFAKISYYFFRVRRAILVDNLLLS